MKLSVFMLSFASRSSILVWFMASFCWLNYSWLSRFCIFLEEMPYCSRILLLWLSNLASRLIISALAFSYCSFRSIIFCLSSFSIFLEEIDSFSLVISCSLAFKNSFLCLHRAIYLSDSILYCIYSSLSLWYFAWMSDTFLRLLSIYMPIFFLMP